jgi:hypothetical protein
MPSTDDLVHRPYRLVSRHVPRLDSLSIELINLRPSLVLGFGTGMMSEATPIILIDLAYIMKKVSTAATTMKPPQTMYAFGPSIPLSLSGHKYQAAGTDSRCAEDIGQCDC